MVSFFRAIGLLLVILGALVVLPIVQYFRVVWGAALTLEIVFWVILSVLLLICGFSVILTGAVMTLFGED